MTDSDYDALTNPGIPRISSISASQALRESSSLSSTPFTFAPQPLATGLDSLNDALRNATTGHSASSSSGGVPRGSITEIYGPPGVGKTSVALNIAVKALAASENDRVVWIDTGSPIPAPRLKEMLTGTLKASTSSQSTDPIDNQITNCMSRLHHLRAPSLPHLLSLFAQPPVHFPGKDTSLIVIDTISAPFQSYFPNATEVKSRLDQQHHHGHSHRQGQGSEIQQKQTTQWLLNRKWNVASDLAQKIVKLASSSPPTNSTSSSSSSRGVIQQQHKKPAIILLNQTQTKIRGQPRPTLYPAIGGGPSWENCIHTRIALYRDWWDDVTAFNDDETNRRSHVKRVRYAEVMKRAGKLISVRTKDDIFPFVIEDGGLRELHYTTTTTTHTTTTSRTKNVASIYQQGQPQQGQLQKNTITSTSLPILFSSSMPQSTSTTSVRKRKVDEVADSEDDDDDENNDISGNETENKDEV